MQNWEKYDASADRIFRLMLKGRELYLLMVLLNPLRTTQVRKKIVCEKCGKSHAPFTMRNFSFNKPEGAVLFLPIGDMNWMTEVLKNASVYYGFPFDVDAPVKDFCEPLKNLLLYGVYDERFTKFFPDVPFPKVRKEGKYEGVVNILQRRYEEKINNEDVREKLESFMIYQKCPECDGDRLSNESRNVFVGDINIAQAASLSLDELLNWLTSLEQNLDENVLQMFRTVFGELRRKIENLIDVGLGYLSLMRSFTTLSMGEVRRIKLTDVSVWRMLAPLCVGGRMVIFSNIYSCGAG